ncbi:MAG: tetratricopeptide repeat protein [Candidatus Binataceae bacterium]
MDSRAARIAMAAGVLVLAAAAVGCESATIASNQEMVKEHQAQIEQMQREIAAHQAGQSAGYAPAPAASEASAGGCDRGIEAKANRNGGDRFATGDFSGALGYYRDALTACPGDPRAELNIARAYEALGDKVKAVKYYRAAAKPSNGTIGDPQEQAQAALRRLQMSELP